MKKFNYPLEVLANLSFHKKRRSMASPRNVSMIPMQDENLELSENESDPIGSPSVSHDSGDVATCSAEMQTSPHLY